MGDTHFQNLDPRILHLLLQFLLHDAGYLLAASAKGTLISALACVIGVSSGGVSCDGITLDGQIVLVILHIEYRFCGIFHFPYDNRSDLNGISQFIVYLLLFVVQGHGFQGNLFIGLCLCVFLFRFNAHALQDRGAGASCCTHCGIDSCHKGIDPVKAVLIQGSVIFSEQSQHKRFIGVDDL